MKKSILVLVLVLVAVFLFAGIMSAEPTDDAVVKTERVLITSLDYVNVEASGEGSLSYREYENSFFIDSANEIDRTTRKIVKVSNDIPVDGGTGVLGFVATRAMTGTGIYELGFNADGIAIEFEKLPFDPYNSYGTPDTDAETIRIGYFMKTPDYNYDADTRVYIVEGNTLTALSIEDLTEDWNDQARIYFDDNRKLTELYITQMDGVGDEVTAYEKWEYSEGVREGFDLVENPYSVQYALYDPIKDGKSDEGKYPLLIYCHGLGGGATKDGLIGGSFLSPSVAKNYTTDEYQNEFETSDPNYSGAYIMLPRANEFVNNMLSSQGWLFGQREGSNPRFQLGDASYEGKATHAAALIANIKDLIANNPNIDPDRIYLTGFSAGGYMSWMTLFADTDDLFAAVSPQGPAFYPIGPLETFPEDVTHIDLGLMDKLKRVKDVPIWLIHSRNDEVCVWHLTSGAVFNSLPKYENVSINGQYTTWGILQSFAAGTGEVVGNPLTRVTVSNNLKTAAGAPNAMQHSSMLMLSNNKYNSGITVDGTTLEFYDSVYGTKPGDYNEASPSADDKASLYSYGANPDYSSESWGDTFISWLNACGNARAAENWENPFTDVSEGQWFYDAVRYVNMRGLFRGTAENTFSPDMAMSRGMLVTVLWREAGSPQVDDMPFTDVSEGSYYYTAIAWAAKNNIVNGIGDNLFDPEADVTREQMAAIIERYAKSSGIDLEVTREYAAFADADKIADYAKPSVEALYCAGIINGKDNNLFDPQGSATRAEAATILRGFLEMN